MSDQLQYKQTALKLQSPLVKWMNIISPLYQWFVPISIRFRKNYQLAKLSDVQLLVLLGWQVELDMTDQRLFYRFLLSIGFTGLPERSRFNRISANALETFKFIREGLIKAVMPSPTYTIIDSFPMPLCHPIRNHRARLLNPYSDIRYNSTKNQWY